MITGFERLQEGRDRWPQGEPYIADKLQDVDTTLLCKQNFTHLSLSHPPNTGHCENRYIIRNSAGAKDPKVLNQSI